MGPRAAVPHSEILKTLKNFEIFDNETGELKSKTNTVWKDICATWDNRMKRINLYFYVSQNRQDILKSYIEVKNVNYFNNSKEQKVNTSDTVSINTDLYSDNSDFNFDEFHWDSKHKFSEKKIQFKISLLTEQWLNMKPQEKLNNRGELYYSLQSGWTNILSELIFVQEKLPCVYSFKNQKIINTDDKDYYLIKVSGVCSDSNCKAQIYGRALFRFAYDNVSFEFHTIDTRGLLHSKKRYISGTQRKSLKKILKHKKANVYRSELINKYHKYGDQIGPLVPSNDVLNRVRFEAKNEDYGVRETIWKSLEHFKTEVEFSRAVKQIGFDKFFFMYWTPEQIDVYNDVIKIGTSVSIDATGSVVRKIMRSENNFSSHIFLYQIIIHIENIIIPCGQLLSERQDTRIVEFWLREWISSGAHIPLEVVTDMSITLQNAITLATNGIFYKKYLSICFDFLMGRNGFVPRPFIRIDIAHLMHCVARLKCLSRAKPAVKDFYLRCIGFMSTIENFANLEKAMKSILIISQNESKCYTEIQWILKRIETFKFDDSVNYKEIKQFTFCENNGNNCTEHISCNDEMNEPPVATVDHDNNTDSLSTYIDQIVEQTCSEQNSNMSVNFNDVNMYYFPEIVNDLKRLFKQFPSWTNVMLNCFNSKNIVSTSARSENYFRFVKGKCVRGTSTLPS